MFCLTSKEQEFHKVCLHPESYGTNCDYVICTGGFVPRLRENNLFAWSAFVQLNLFI